MTTLFPTENEHKIKKQIVNHGGEADPNDNKTFFYNKSFDSEHNDDDNDRSEGGNIQPEEVCKYERMHSSNVRLRHLGLDSLRSCEKINTIKNRYIK